MSTPARRGWLLCLVSYLLFSPFDCVLVLPLLLALPRLFLLYFFLSHADCCPNCLCRLSSARCGSLLSRLLSYLFYSSFSCFLCCSRLSSTRCCLPCLDSFSSSSLSQLFSRCLRVSLFRCCFPVSLDSATSATSFFSCAPVLLAVACYVSLHFLPLLSFSQLFSSRLRFRVFSSARCWFCLVSTSRLPLSPFASSFSLCCARLVCFVRCCLPCLNPSSSLLHLFSQCSGTSFGRIRRAARSVKTENEALSRCNLSATSSAASTDLFSRALRVQEAARVVKPRSK